MRSPLLLLDPVSMTRPGKEEEVSDTELQGFTVSIHVSPQLLWESPSASPLEFPLSFKLLLVCVCVCVLDRLAESLLFKFRCTM